MSDSVCELEPAMMASDGDSVSQESRLSWGGPLSLPRGRLWPRVLRPDSHDPTLAPGQRALAVCPLAATPSPRLSPLLFRNKVRLCSNFSGNWPLVACCVAASHELPCWRAQPQALRRGRHSCEGRVDASFAGARRPWVFRAPASCSAGLTGTGSGGQAPAGFSLGTCLSPTWQ